MEQLTQAPPSQTLTPCTIVDQKRLFELYQSVPDAQAYAELLKMEQEWIVPLAGQFTDEAPSFTSVAELMTAMKEFLVEEGRSSSENHRFLAQDATYEQFKYVVREFAVDGLTESLSLLAVVPRLPYRSGMAVFRVLIDELGCGNEAQAHSQLYRDLLTELDMPTDMNSYLDIGPESYSYVNLFHWLANRAESPEYFLGGYAYFEASVLYGFQSFAHAARRLKIKNHAYYTEHLYIDNFHSKQMRTAIREKQAETGIDLAKVWAGVRITSAIVGHATEMAIFRSRSVGQS
ncbi:hypothetical protein AMK10_16865 [Streptomyces sp. CB02058]|nr:hypothetical protein AMK10_16865 [Streptomyces sp. CB02058]